MEEPGDVLYLGHVTVENGTAKEISTEIMSFFKDNEISTDALVAVGCDGTAVNTGVHPHLKQKIL